MAYIPVGITSIVSTVPSSVLVGSSIFGQLPGGTATLGSVVTIQGTNPHIFTGSVQGTVSVLGTVPVTQSGNWITSIVNIIPSSVIIGTSIFGQLPSGTAPLGSVATLQGTNPWIVNFQNSSIVAIPVGSVIGYWHKSPSIVGTYAEDAAHATGDKGVFGLGVRNDTLSSITSADLDYSPHGVGPTGETIATITPFTKGIQGSADLRVVQGASVLVIAAQGASIFSYIRSAQITNLGSASVLVTFGGGLGSILGYTIAPSGGGSNINFDPWLKTGENSAFTASISGTASVLVSAQGFIAKI